MKESLFPINIPHLETYSIEIQTFVSPHSNTPKTQTHVDIDKMSSQAQTHIDVDKCHSTLNSTSTSTHVTLKLWNRIR